YADLHDLAPLVRGRRQPSNPQMRALLSRDRSVKTSIDVRFQIRVTEIIQRHLEPSRKNGAIVVLDPANGDVLALASFPSPENGVPAGPDTLLDRARYGQYPPGSTFKLVTAIAALRLDSGLMNKKYQCHRLPDGRAGAMVTGWNRPIRDDVGD